MTVCAAKGCDNSAAFSTRTRPAWCDDHITQLLTEGGLAPIEPFTKRASYRLTKCLKCGCEAHYKFDYVLDRNATGVPCVFLAQVGNEAEDAGVHRSHPRRFERRTRTCRTQRVGLSGSTHRSVACRGS